jgi:hypothetical protein
VSLTFNGVADLFGAAYKASPEGKLTSPNIPTSDTGGGVNSAASPLASLASKAGAWFKGLLPGGLNPTDLLVPGGRMAAQSAASATAAAAQSGKAIANAAATTARSVSTGVSVGFGAAIFLIVAVFGLWAFSTIKHAGS